MTELSPAALAVRDAAEKQTDLDFRFAPAIAAAVLQAAAERIAKEVPPRQFVESGPFWREGYVEGVIFFRDELLAIATELEAQ